MRNSQQKVVFDMENQYKNARQTGDLSEICSQAKVVASTYLYLQGFESKNYRVWRSVEKRDCNAFQAEESRIIQENAFRSVNPFQAIMEQSID